jgi:hypothetical protein
MTNMEVSWKYDIQNGYAKLIPPKIPNRISLMLKNYNITTSNTRKEGPFDSVIGHSEFTHWGISTFFLVELKNPFLRKIQKPFRQACLVPNHGEK